MLDFTTGNYYSVVAFNFSVDREGTGTYDIHIKLNGSRIYNSEFDGTPEPWYSTGKPRIVNHTCLY